MPDNIEADSIAPGGHLKKRHWQIHKGSTKRRVSRVESLRNLFLRSSSRNIHPSATLISSEQIRDDHHSHADITPTLTVEKRNKSFIEKGKKHAVDKQAIIAKELAGRSLSLENVSADFDTSLATKKSQFPHAFIRSRLNALTEEKNLTSISSVGAAVANGIGLSIKSDLSRSSASCDNLLENTHKSDASFESIRYLSVISVSHDGAFQMIKRKRSFSLAALPICPADATATFVTCRSEESGYESDTTRNGSESPGQLASVESTTATAASAIQISFISTQTSAKRAQEEQVPADNKANIGPISSDAFRTVETSEMNDFRHSNRTDEEKLSLDDSYGHLKSATAENSSRTSGCRMTDCNRSRGERRENNHPPTGKGQRLSRKDSVVPVALVPASRSRHLPIVKDSNNDANFLRSSSLDRKEWQKCLQQASVVEINDSDSLSCSKRIQVISPIPKSASLPPGLMPTPMPGAVNRQFKMLRLVKGETGELGIYITKKHSPDSGSLGYVIAAIEPGQLAHR